MSFRKELAARLDKRISDLGFDNVDAEPAIGVDNSTVSRWRKGQRTPSVEHIPALCRWLGLTADELLGMKPIDRTYDPLQIQAHQLMEDIREAVYRTIDRKPEP